LPPWIRGHRVPHALLLVALTGSAVMAAMAGGSAPLSPAARDYPLARATPRDSLGMYPDWSGIRDRPFPIVPADVNNPVLTADDVTDVNATFVADPFLLWTEDRWYMFFEVYVTAAGRGQIAFATSNDCLHWDYQRVVLAENWHLSYPFVFMYGGDYYMLPETSATHEVRLYRADDFPFRWAYVATLSSGRVFVDPTLLRYDNTWWLFVGGASSGSCRLYYADALLGPWTEHPQSPIALGRAKSRPAGRSFVYAQDRIIRLAQKCDGVYGEAVRAFEVDMLSRTAYHEFEIPESPVLGPGGDWAQVGMHHCDPWWVGGQWIAAVDGRGDANWAIGIYCSEGGPADVHGRWEPDDARQADLHSGGGALRLVCANPVRSGAAVTFELPRDAIRSSMALDLYDAQGRLVRSLADAPAAPGAQRVTWDGRDALGHPAPGGLYTILLRACGQSAVRRIVVTK
jgi:hypothetical protein